ncbi:hypothetical protein J3R30DRAFT_3697790 [Lentinula aciculospora]|uniref:DNA recombination and repair protein Rad51-like C-terminal domain-containing protein n=1 Tax=Lentinula aciculospora TaxID=153920 RepID=A0A9W9ANU2_9AGAR|nr:hypothetical protein J3R30DRAFT_3697790 [Lentinula aciculospora]
MSIKDDITKMSLREFICYEDPMQQSPKSKVMRAKIEAAATPVVYFLSFRPPPTDVMNFDGMIREIRSESLQTRDAKVFIHVLFDAKPQCDYAIESTPLSTCVLGSDSSTRHRLPFELPRLGDVLEIQGPPASGKSHLLYLLMIYCIIPTACSSISLGGWNKAAVLFDTDASFDLVRFKQLLTSYLETTLANTDSNTVQLLVKRSLQNLHIFHPGSSIQLAVTLLRLPSYHQTKLPDSEIGILAIDSMSAFYWLDRFTAEQLGATHAPRAHEFTNPLQHVITALQQFHRTHNPLIAFTNWGLTRSHTNPDEGERNVPTYRQHLNPAPALFPNAGAMLEHPFSSGFSLTHHITLSMPTLPQFPVGFSFADTCAQELPVVSTTQIIGDIRSASSFQPRPFTFSIEGRG